MKAANKISKSKSLIVANWKNTPDSYREAKKNFDLIKKTKIDSKKIIPVICPSVIHLPEIKKSYSGTVYNFGSQDVHFEDKKPRTGEISIDQLTDLGIQYCIVGHADHRELGEDNFTVAQKISNLIDKKITPILCIGEIDRDAQGQYLRFVEQQLIESLSKIKKSDLDKIVIAYEPVWAIGTGKKSITTHEIHQMVIFIKKILTSKFDKKIAMNMAILYGGSVDPENAKDILNNGEVRGLLIGRASANPHSFIEILKSI